jgi:hypothetical protein
MCLIERLPAIEIKKPLAWTGGTYYGIGPLDKPKHQNAAAPAPKKVPVLAFVALEADMTLPARQMHANIMRMMNEPTRVYYTANKKRVLQKHRRVGLRTISAMVSFLQ